MTPAGIEPATFQFVAQHNEVKSVFRYRLLLFDFFCGKHFRQNETILSLVCLTTGS